ncbi:MAE_28990/MAE_18760 family HEPN-like nuclease [Klebsiella spallanzanii]|uniref:MAE_28990/MAE_18760 family HEPN-like nuclease n=1 Tax=Klebsiella spallanzanii TaxID=2587528 RepID=UPI0025956C29|nr:MAE_28990/MAE_18760 family HEPN-like nuclease [Klebsiella spallanzanii]MDM4206893.1 MAE_28990/MAE_18760 family HEPN-like nuclease [Klebsiella spallanzanii]
MEINLKDELQSFIDSDKAWRKKEMTLLKSFIFSSTGTQEHTYIRAGVALLYSHWEGHIKTASLRYVEYLNRLELRLSQLSDNNVTSFIYDKFMSLNGSKVISSYSGISDVVCNNLDNEVFNISPMKIIKTESNLKLRQLDDILHVIGLDNSVFMANKAHIDETLLNYRNKISHGERTEGLKSTTLSKVSYNALHDKIIELIDHFDDLLIEHVLGEKYLKIPPKATS